MKKYYTYLRANECNQPYTTDTIVGGHARENVHYEVHVMRSFMAESRRVHVPKLRYKGLIMRALLRYFIHEIQRTKPRHVLASFFKTLFCMCCGGQSRHTSQGGHLACTQR